MKLKLFTLILSFVLFQEVYSQNNAFPLSTSFWPTKQISVCWDNPKPENKTFRDVVRAAISETWAHFSLLQFTDWCPASEKNCDIHIYIDDVRPHTIALGKNLAHKEKGMILNFSFFNFDQGCRNSGMQEFCIKAHAVHEFGHALGFAHEQNRKDCEFENCPPEMHDSSIGDYPIGGCDSLSIMNYCSPVRGQSYQLSNLDINALQKIYSSPSHMAAPILVKPELFHIAETINPNNLGTRRINTLIRVFVVGTQQRLNTIQKVTYHLHNTFRHREITVTSVEDKFGLGLKVWGEFEITADLFYKDGHIETLKRYLSFASTNNTTSLPEKPNN